MIEEIKLYEYESRIRLENWIACIYSEATAVCYVFPVGAEEDEEPTALYLTQ